MGFHLKIHFFASNCSKIESFHNSHMGFHLKIRFLALNGSKTESFHNTHLFFHLKIESFHNTHLAPAAHHRRGVESGGQDDQVLDNGLNIKGCGKAGTGKLW
uniref:Uncharacterized protein n=1 Tax=Helianthus annuus TaxID=4232 RepID=A0A251TFC6_HELAN